LTLQSFSWGSCQKDENKNKNKKTQRRRRSRQSSHGDQKKKKKKKGRRKRGRITKRRKGLEEQSLKENRKMKNERK
jgi:hypothetical protein